MKLIRITQGTPAWLTWRQGGIGGSDAAAILGLSPFATRENLLREKISRTEREMNFAMRRGVALEPEARALYEERHRCLSPPACVEHDQHSWMRVSLDGLASQRNLREQWGVEIKCGNWETHSATLATGEVPEHYRPQCQWQLLVSDLPFLHYVSFTKHERFGEADRLATVVVDHDAELQARLLEECEKFWGEVLEGRKALAAWLVRPLNPRVEAEFA